MKTESNIKPSAVVVEEHGDNAEVIFREPCGPFEDGKGREE